MSASLEYSGDASARSVSDGDPSSSAPDDASFEASDDDHVALMIAELVDNYDGY